MNTSEYYESLKYPFHYSGGLEDQQVKLRPILNPVTYEVWRSHGCV